MKAILKLRAAGYRVELDGERVRYRLEENHPEPDPGALTRVLEDLKAHREEVVAFLRAEAYTHSSIVSPIHERTDQPDQPDQDAQPCPPYPLPVYSCILDGRIWIVPNGWTDPVDGPAYMWSEIRALDRQKVTPEALRAVHQVKNTFDGEILKCLK